MNTSPKTNSSPRGSRLYQIHVSGRLGRDWEDRMGDMKITGEISRDGNPRTLLSGPIRDQAELMGLLNTLYELHLTILSVECGPALEGQDAR